MSKTNAYNTGLGQSMALHQSCTLDSWPFALRFLLPEKSVQKSIKIFVVNVFGAYIIEVV